MRILVSEYALDHVVNTMIDNGYKVSVEWKSDDYKVTEDKLFMVTIRRSME